jgi:hypothetical protein
MDWERQFSDGAEQPAPTSQPETGNSSCTGPAQITDVLFDQLQYLIEHIEGNCSTSCPDCRRLQMVTDWLLLPFRCRSRA